ncbi:tetratricopeptide repeat protein [Calothrix sp. CCY 0018]|uniref:tetratricopeptide repeat protein n=1 Tax=Calothrix sp. CCY 0018 TaxID=3103864 RepID=UPI0039C5FF0B
MINRLLRWFKKLWQRLFGKKQVVSLQKPNDKAKPQELSDAEYESFFLKLLNDEDWSRGSVKASLDINNIVESNLVEWLRGFGERLLAGDGKNRELAERMVRLSEVGFGELSQVAGEIGRELLGGEEEVGEAEVWFDRGFQQCEAGDFEQAIASYDKAIEIKPDYYEAWVNRGVALGELGRFEQAIASYDKAIEIKPDFHEAWGNRGVALDELGRVEQAIASYDKAIEIKPDYHEAWGNRGIALIELGRFDQAIASSDKAIEIKPDYYQAWHSRGNALGKLGRLEKAIASYDKAIEIKPDYHEAWGNRGVALYDLGRFNQAIASYDKAVEIKPDYHEAWYNRGIALIELGRFDQAIASFEKAIRFEEAIVSLDKAIEIKADYYQAWGNRGVALYELGRFDQAIASYDKAVEIKPDYYEAWYNRSYLLDKLGRFEEAIVSLDKAVEIKPDYYEAWYNRSIMLRELGMFEQAIESCDKAIEIKPDYYNAWYTRGVVQYELRRFEQAIESFEKAVEIKPDYYNAWHNRGTVLYELKRFEQAIASYDKAVEIKPDFHEAWYSRGNALDELGRFEQAIASYDKAIEIKPDFHDAWGNRGATAGESISFNQFLASSNSFTIKNPALNQRGYQGRLASYREGLKYCPQSLGWGKLHQAIGNAHYYQGIGERDYRQYWLQAESEYKQALTTLTPEAFPELHLQVLKNLIRVLFGLNKHDEAKQYRRQALEVFRNLLNSPNKSSLQKRKLQAEFYGFSQMRVDVLIENGDFIPALESAERDKNFYLTWILDNQKEYILSPSYSEIQKLVNPQPNTAIIYWHISPFALTTFIIKPGADKPIVIPTQNLDNLEAWIKNWDKQYESYRKGKKQQSSNPVWRDNLPQLLTQLSEILNIPRIIESIQKSNFNIQNLILIPHRDLHRFPLHALFPDNFTINYLPSAQIGLTLNSQPQNSHQHSINSNLLIVEYSGFGREAEGLQMLTYTQIESETIARIFENTNSKHISDDEANKNTVQQALAAGYNIFHFSGHGSYDNKRPQNSAIYLNRNSTDAEINPDLTLPEIRNLNLSGYQLVSLSACETAITGNETVEAEYVGLVSAFLYQAVSYVVSSLWTVNEISTSLLMIYFYRQIRKGKTPNIALVMATKWLKNLTYRKLQTFYRFSYSQLGENNSSRIVLKAYLQSIENHKGKLFEHPYYWAGFIITGI